MSQLRSLHVDLTRVSDKGADELRAALPSLARLTNSKPAPPEDRVPKAK
jgi:hypothetical protein